MGHLWHAQLRAAQLVTHPRPGAHGSFGPLGRALDDSEVWDRAAALLLQPAPEVFDDDALARWFAGGTREDSEEARYALLAALGVSRALHARFLTSPRDLEPDELERARLYWRLNNLLWPRAERVDGVRLELTLTPFGDDALRLFAMADAPSFALRLAVDLAQAAGFHPETESPIVAYFQAQGATWPELGGRDDEAEGIVWETALTRDAADDGAPEVRALLTIHPHWLPGLCFTPFRSWAY